MAKSPEARRKATAKYNSKMDNVQFRAPKGYRAQVMEHAKAQGESMAKFIMRAIATQMALDNEKK